MTPDSTKPGRVVPAVLLSAFFLPALSACQPEVRELSPEEGRAVAEIGEPAASELLRTLVGRLTAAMEDGGPASAIEFCSAEALRLTRLVESGLEGGLALKRTSFRYRNPDNAPDEAEAAALLYFERTIAEGGQAPSSFVQQVSEEEVRYYKPLFVGEFCLRCHGDPQGFDSEVARVLSERYPGDLATGYEAGAFRGVVRVSVPASAVGEG